MAETKIVTDRLDTPQNINLLTNGGLELWSNGTTFVNSPDGIFHADRWQFHNNNGTGSVTVTRDSTTVDSGGFSYKMVTTGVTTARYYISNIVDNFKEYRGKTITFSVRVNANVASSIQVALSDGITSDTVSSTHSGGGTFETLSVTKTISATASILFFAVGQYTGGTGANGTFYFDSAMATIGSTINAFVPTNPEIDNLKNIGTSGLASSSSNILINGGFEQWHQGTIFNSVANNVVTADKWIYNNNTGTMNITQEGTTKRTDSVFALKGVQTGISASNFIFQDADNFTEFRGRTLTVSMLVNTSTASAVRIAIADGVTTVNSPFHTGGGTFETLSATLAISASNTRVRILIEVAANNTFYIDNAMLTIGASNSFIPTPRNVDLYRAGIYASYRRPNIGFGGITAVGLDTELNGVVGVTWVMFPDGDVRCETDSTRRTFVITRNTVLTNSGAQSGLRSGLSEASNTWYFMYAVKISDHNSGFVLVGDDIQGSANVSTLNTRYGVNGWKYMGMIRNGDNNDAPSDILDFIQNGSLTMFNNIDNPSTVSDGIWNGMELASSTSATSISWTYATGITGTNVPGNLKMGIVSNIISPTTNGLNYLSDGPSRNRDYMVLGVVGNLGVQGWRATVPVNKGFSNSISGAAGVTSIVLNGFWDDQLDGSSASPF